MPTAELTVRMPLDEVEFLKTYAREHGMTEGELIAAYVRRLKANGHKQLHPDIVKITGLIPADIHVKSEYHQHLLDKHK